MWSIATRTRVSDAIAITFFVKCFNPLKLYLLSGNIFRKWFASYFLFIHIFIHAFNNNVMSNGKFYLCNEAFTDVRYIAAGKEYLKRIQIIFIC